ncbi:MAG TPA: MATE family efflux transporter [Kofleriaceae bacterium]|nr:MATE family efflux transporter [Kofleriaceae bacterium]
MASRASLRLLLGLAFPMVLARASQAVITFADAIQVRELGATALAATATGGLNVTGLVILPMGTVFIVQSFVAQLVGSGRRGDARRFAWYGLAIAALAGAASALLIPLVGPAMSLTGYSPAVRDQMTDYMAIRMLSVAAVVGVEALGNWYGGLGNTRMQMTAGLVTMALAVGVNWVLIGGHLGAPALGVRGAAVASVIASWSGFAVLAVAFWRRWGGVPRSAGPLGLRIAELGRVVRFGVPNGLNWFLEYAAFQLFVNVVLASLGDDTVAAINVVLTVNAASVFPAAAIATAGSILVGQAIGRGERDAVWAQVKTTLACTASWMAVLGLGYALFPRSVLGLFIQKPGTGALISIATMMLWISALWQVLNAVTMTLSETLRAAGDTAWTAAVRLILAWLLFAPSALAAVKLAGAGPVGAMLCLIGYVAALAVATAWRYRSGAWRRIELIEPVLVT